MPESFESMLAAMAEEAVSETRTPVAAAVRGRGAQRSARRRLAASLMAFTAVCGVVGGGVADRVLSDGRSTSVAPAASLSAPAPTPSPSPSSAGALRADATAAPGSVNPGKLNPDLLAGLWTRSDGTQGYLIVYPLAQSGSTDSDLIGISEQGFFPLCAGRLYVTPAGSGYEILGVTCAGPAYSQLNLSYADATGKQLVLHVPSSTGQETSIPYSRQSVSVAQLKSVTDLGVVVGTWVDGSARITIEKSGSVNWSAVVDGSVQTGTGKAAGSFQGGMIVTAPCPSAKSICSILQLQYDARTDQLTAIGSQGAWVFDRKS